MAKMSAFGRAFAEARKRGDKEFTFGGKKFHTRTKEEDDAAKSSVKDTSSDSKPVSTAGAIASKNTEGLSKLKDMVTKKVERKEPPSTAGAIASKNFKSGGSVKSSASKRADGCATKGKTKGRMV